MARSLPSSVRVRDSHARRLAKPGRGSENEDVGGQKARAQLWPVVPRPHVEENTRHHVVIRDPSDFSCDPVRMDLLLMRYRRDIMRTTSRPRGLKA